MGLFDGNKKKCYAENLFEKKRPKSINSCDICTDMCCKCSGVTKGSGYLYISKETVKYRKDARTIKEANRKMKHQISEAKQFVSRMGGIGIYDESIPTALLLCEREAQEKKLSLKMAAKDAKYWWETGLVPLRATTFQK